MIVRSSLASPTVSAVVVRIAAADPVVAAHRAQLDPSAAWGVPAHVTVLYPFIPPAALDDGVIARVASIAAATASFTCRFERVGWFGEKVVHLLPDPAGAFLSLIRDHVEAFPEHPPYGGAIDPDAVVPHLTIGEGGNLTAMRDAADAVATHLPIEADIDTVSIMVGAYGPARWHVVADLPLAPA